MQKKSYFLERSDKLLFFLSYQHEIEDKCPLTGISVSILWACKKKHPHEEAELTVGQKQPSKQV